jgi:hypothetical protein
MAKIVKVIPLTLTYTIATGTTSYHVAAPNFKFLWLSAMYPNSKVYFEAVIDGYGLAGYYGYAALYTTGGAYVTGSELKHDTTTATRFRSGELSLTDNTVYELWVKSTNGGIPGNVYTASLIIVQEATPITATETQISIGKYILNEAANLSYTDIDGMAFYYDSAQFDGTVAIYFEATIYGSSAGGTIYAKLYDTDGNAVADSEISVNGSTPTRVRSAAISLTTGKTYIVRMKHVSGILWDYMGGRIIIQQTNNPTKTQTVIPIVMHVGSSAVTNYTICKGRAYWDDDDWSVLAKTTYFEATLKISNATYTAYMELYNGAAQVDERTTQATTRTRLRSGALNLVDNTTYYARYKSSSASGTVTFYGARIIVAIDICAVTVTTQTFSDSGEGIDLINNSEGGHIYSDSGAGAETFKTLGAIMKFIESALGIDEFDKAFTKVFDDSGSASEILSRFRTLLFSESAEGTEEAKTNKLIMEIESGLGADYFPANKSGLKFFENALGDDDFLFKGEMLYKEIAICVESWTIVYPYPVSVDRIVIMIRDVI